ncbi:MAG: ACP S-malonyltransferase [Campylobacteraceae bacterium]|jgi:[acyl-carrier-protein] S-malonyltransferase|nr:ACP S-malonyltransferase [Campylobacteraceae bacterium]
MLKDIAFVFPGQGSQAIGMGKDFYDKSPLVQDIFKKASNRLGIDMCALMFEENENLNETEFAQPAILLVSAAALRLFQENMDITPKFVLGHSLGEITSLIAAGALDMYDALELVRARGLLMKKACEGKNAAMMVLVGLDDEKSENICEEARQSGHKIWAANYNSDGQIVIAGLKDDLNLYADKFKADGAKRVMLLPMSVASHCPLLEDAKAPLREKLEAFIKESFKSPVISNVNAKAYSSKKEAVELLENQLVSPVLYKQSVSRQKADAFIEFGGSVLKGLNKRLNNAPTFSITDTATLEETLNTIKEAK